MLAAADPMSTVSSGESSSLTPIHCRQRHARGAAEDQSAGDAATARATASRAPRGIM
jgi:hypothetical protein